MSDDEVGAFTFVFTDMEGSTRLWEADPEAMRIAVRRHDDLLSELVRSRGGNVFANLGDGVCAAFRTSGDAIEACIRAQLAFSNEDWGLLRPPLVRMAVHHAPAVQQGDDFESSPELILCARLLAIAHGGQILVSEPTAASLERHAHDIVLKDLGRHRLKDLVRPARVFQAVHPQLRADFPALRSRNLSHNLPAEVTSFIGREDDLATLKRLLSERRVVTVAGAGGCGKTRLALKVGHESLDRFRDGVWLIELASTSDEGLIVQQAATVLGIRDDANRPVVDPRELGERLEDKELLLILDNCEHLVDASARLVGDLLRCAPHMRVLATSQQPLRVSGEEVYDLSPMEVPPSGLEGPTDPLDYESARLFLDRARSAGISLPLDDASADAVRQICNDLDGLPLALELAAARVGALSVPDIAARLKDRFRFLTGGRRDAPPRHQTLLSTVEWSYQLLSDRERELFDRLSVFRGGSTLEAVQAVCRDAISDPEDVVGALTELSAKSLVRARHPAGRRIRYDQLETLRLYGRGRLRDVRKEDDVCRAHADYFTDLANQADAELRGPRQGLWLERLEEEQSNFRAALEWATESGSTEVALRLVGALWWFWFRRGLWQEGRRSLEQALALTTDDAAGRLRAICGGALFCTVQNDYEEANALVEEGLALASRSEHPWESAWLESIAGELAWYKRDIGTVRRVTRRSLFLFEELEDRWGMAWVHRLAGQAEGTAGNVAVAIDHHQESLRLFRKLEDYWGVAWELYFLGAAARSTGDPSTAERCCLEALNLFEGQGDQAGAAHVLQERAEVARLDARYPDAETLYADSLTLLREVGDKHCSAASLTGLGLVAHAAGNSDEALARLSESLSLCVSLDHTSGAAWALQGIAAVLADRGEAPSAVEILGLVENLRTASGLPLVGRDRAAFDEILQGLQRTMPQKDIEAAWQRGAASSTEEVLNRLTIFPRD